MYVYLALLQIYLVKEYSNFFAKITKHKFYVSLQYTGAYIMVI